ncbi:MAG: hypothetical protein EOO24_25065 [Comamonadaceae bacterium]|nr:MAG: hypothetical protein EOO24_25065 [Comamonadaceae bacterium]
MALAAAAAAPSFAHTDAGVEQGMNTMWEVLWHQAGTPTRLVRWEQDLKVRVHGVNASAHRAHALAALRAVAAEAGLKVIDVSNTPDAATQANVNVEITANSGLADAQPCETRLQFETETRIDGATMQMRDSDAKRCAYHEAMHVMGVRGHPAGETVLSYFPTKTDALQPLDKVMLRAWYSQRAHGGMTALEVLPVLADELVASMPDPASARVARDRFMAKTIEQMQAFAAGEADVPEIVRKSGKSSEAGIRFGRMEMSYYLGIAYQDGVTVARDATQAARWLQRAATMGSRPALARLGAAAAQR